MSMKYNIYIIFAIFLIVLISSCESFLEIEHPNSRINSTRVFQNEETAEAAMHGLYKSLGDGFAGGGSESISVLAGLSAGEIYYVPGLPTRIDHSRQELQSNSILPNNTIVLTNWSQMYHVLYQANLIIEKIQMNPKLKNSNQLLGEAYFIRAYTLFHLTNFYGDVPIPQTTDYAINGKLKKSKIDECYSLIKQDLLKAIELLNHAYHGPARLRANRGAAQGLMARVALYENDWPSAIRWSSEVISQSQLYSLSNEVNEVFLIGSQEAIWQYAHSSTTLFVGDVTLYLVNNEHFLSDNVISWFKESDKRRNDWFFQKPSKSYVPYKLKTSAQGNVTEHGARLRLAEQYLIRSEGYAQVGEISKSLDDLNKIRTRAGLHKIEENQINTQEVILDHIMIERRREFFAEGGHLWFDLKRTGKATQVLSVIKPWFEESDLWYPIPESEVLKNPYLND
jgi:hypothetical protein